MATRDDLWRYADLILRVGIGPLDDRRLTVRSHVEAKDLVRVLVARAYELGTPRVTVQWTDPEVDVLHATVGPEGAVEVVPDEAGALAAVAERGDGFVRIGGGEVPHLDGPAGQRFATLDATWRQAAQPLFERLRADRSPWTVACFPTASWSAQVFPDIAEEADAIEQLWQAIRRVTRLDDDDPVAAWESHAADLRARASHLTDLDLVELEYDGPGTDLRVGVDGRRWVGGSATRTGNVPNLPTEEVFTSPDRDRVEGSLALSKPYVFAGEPIVDARLRFEGGVVTTATCSSGQTALDALLDTDEGSRRLGEVALVPHSSRVARERLQWHHPLYDENEDCHVALGMSYVFTAPGAEELSPEEQLGAGLNHSRLHEDVVVGSDSLDVTGIDRAGGRHPLLTAGEWAFAAA